MGPQLDIDSIEATVAALTEEAGEGGTLIERDVPALCAEVRQLRQALAAVEKLASDWQAANTKNGPHHLATPPRFCMCLGCCLAAALGAAVTPTPQETGDEARCSRCGGPNVSWCAPSPLWNEVMRGGSIDGPWQYSEIICPTCFCVLTEAAGVALDWRVDAQTVNVPLQTVTPTGRVWDAENWLWVTSTPEAATEPQEESTRLHRGHFGWTATPSGLQRATEQQ